MQRSDYRPVTLRVISIYATRWRHARTESDELAPFPLGRLTEFYGLFRHQLPWVLDHQKLPPDTVRFTVPSDGVRLTNVESWLFALPSEQVVAALTFDYVSPDLSEDAEPTVRLLELCANAQVRIAGRDLAGYVAIRAQDNGAQTIQNEDVSLPPERHHIVFVHESPSNAILSDDVVAHILFRIDPPYRREYLRIERPDGLNRHQFDLGAVTAEVSLLYGQPPFVENSAFLTAVQAVGTAAWLRRISRAAYQQVRTFQKGGQEKVSGRQRREGLEALADELGNLELDLSFTLGFTPTPSLHLESFSEALDKVLDLRGQAQAVNQMFTRLAGSIQSEITAIDIRERKVEERRARHSAFATTVLSVIGVPLGFLVAFFGVNSSDVSTRYSVFNWHHYWLVYRIALVLALVPLGVFAVLHGPTWAQALAQRHRERRQSRLISG